MTPRNQVRIFASMLVLGVLVIITATFLSAADYNAIEDELGEGVTAAISPSVLITALVGGGMIIAGTAGIIINWLQRPVRDADGH